MSMYKVGEEVIVKPDLTEGRSFSCRSTWGHCFASVTKKMFSMRGKKYKIEHISEEDDTCRLEGCSDWFTDEMLLPAQLKKGDIVKLNPDAKLGDFAKGRSNYIGVYAGTRNMFADSFSSRMSFDKEYTIGDLSEINSDAVRLKGFGDNWFESALFTFIRRPEEVKKVTMAEIEEKFGCKIKIVKE